MRATAVLLAAILGPGPALADSVTEQLDHAKQVYEQGDIGGAVDDLQFALQELRGKLGGAYLATFPAPAAGWTVEEVKPEENNGAAAFLGGGSMVKRDYHAPSGDGLIEAQLMTGGSFLQGLASMFMNPQVMASQPNAKRIRVGRDNAVVTFDPAERSGQLMLDVAGKVTVMLDGKNLDGTDPMVDLINRWDLKKVKELAGL